MGASISFRRNSMSSALENRQMEASISFLRNSMSRVLLNVNTASSVHTTFAYLTGLLLFLVGLNYRATNPLNDHHAVTIMFLIAIISYVMALSLLGSNRQINAMVIWVCHICRILACEMLLLLLVSPLWCFFINLSSLLLLLTLLFSYHFFFQLPQSEEGEATQGTDPADLV